MQHHSLGEMRMKEEGDGRTRTDDNITEFAPKGEREGVREDKEGGKGDERAAAATKRA